MGCKFCESPFDECDCWKSRMSPTERVLLTNAMLARRELLKDKENFEKKGNIIVRRGSFGNTKRRKTA